MHTARMQSAAELVKELLAEFEQHFDEITLAYAALEGLERAVAECSALNYYERLLLYRARLEGQSVKRLGQELVRARRRLGLPDDYDVWVCLQNWLSLVQLRLRVLVYESSAVSAARREEGSGASAIVAVEEVSKAAGTEDGTLECAICYAGHDAEMVLTIPCNHGFCRECLTAWFHASQGNSNTCPACRTELFSRPERINSHSEVIFDEYHVMSEENLIRRQEIQILQACESAFWLEEELELQRRTEAECHL